MDELLAEFLTESAENLSQLDLDLVELEQNPNDKDLLGNIFRTIHTIKGTCGFIGLPRLEKVAHTGENLLGKFRDDELQVTEEAITLILQCVDRIKEIFDTLENTGGEPEGDDSELLQKLTNMLEGKSSAEQSSDTNDSDNTTEDSSRSESLTSEEESVNSTAPQVVEESEEATSNQTGALEQPSANEKQQSTQTQANADAKKKGGDNTANQTIRVNVSLLETLINTVSELVLTRNQLLQMMRSQDNDEFAVPLQRLNHITTELQEGVMKTRMQPIGGAWSKLPRLVRDLSQEVGKKINLEMKGAETELDRQVIELIKDPLTHMVRNSADHGLENPKQRLAAGKSDTGRITLNAYHAGGHVIIEIADDGKGLPVEIIKNKIITNGLATRELVDDMSEKQVFQYIFRAGFSTAEKITNVSGRGVGMDVVRSNIEKIGGNIEVSSIAGKGTTFTIKIPLTLAVVSALIIDSGGQRFALPQVSITELVQTSRNSECNVEFINNSPVLRLRNKLYPVVVLKSLLKIEEEPTNKLTLVSDKSESSKQAEVENTNPSETEEEKSQDLSQFDKSYIIVTQIGSQHFGIVVDRVFDTQEIVVKPVSNVLRGINIYAGNTILGDGSVVMILDPNGVASHMSDLELADSKNGDETDSQFGDIAQRMNFLTFKTGDPSPKAVPLTSVVRLEEIDTNDIEFSDGVPVIQYRDQLMPIINMSASSDFSESVRRPVLVFSNKNRFAGIMIESIIDIHETVMKLKLESEREGVFGSIIIDEKATDVLDTDFIIANHFNSVTFSEMENDENISFEDRLVLVSKCPFYTNLLRSHMFGSGFKPVIKSSTNEAKEFLETNPQISAVIVDMSSFDNQVYDFVKTCSQGSDEKCIIGVTNYLVGEDQQKFSKAGGKEYLPRNDHQGIIQTLQEHFNQTRSKAA